MTNWWNAEAERPWKGISWLGLAEAGVQCDASGIVHVPYKTPDGTVFREHLFAADGRTWWAAGEGLIPLGLELLPPRPHASPYALILAEEDSDTFAIREAFAATTETNSIAHYFVLGLPGAATWRSEWRKYAEPFDRVYVIGDGDSAGRRMIDDVVRSVPWARGALLPSRQDARSILQRHGARALDGFLDQADWRSALWAAWRISRSVAELEALLRGEDVVRVAA